MKKKVLLAVLAAALMLTACGGKSESGQREEGTSSKQEAGTSKETESEEETELEVENVKSEEPSPEKKAELQAEKEENESEGNENQEEAAEDNFVKGIVTDTGWESEFLGMRYTLLEGMYMATEEALNEMMGLGVEVLSGDFSEQQLKYAQMRTVYEMMSTDATGANNVVLTIEKLPLKNMETEVYVQSLKTQLGKVTTIPYTITGDDETVSIAGKDFIKVNTQIGSGDDAKKQDYYASVHEGRAICIIVTYSDETSEVAESILNAFTEY